MLDSDEHAERAQAIGAVLLAQSWESGGQGDRRQLVHCQRVPLAARIVCLRLAVWCRALRCETCRPMAGAGCLPTQAGSGEYAVVGPASIALSRRCASTPSSRLERSGPARRGCCPRGSRARTPTSPSQLGASRRTAADIRAGARLGVAAVLLHPDIQPSSLASGSDSLSRQRPSDCASALAYAPLRYATTAETPGAAPARTSATGWPSRRVPQDRDRPTGTEKRTSSPNGKPSIRRSDRQRGVPGEEVVRSDVNGLPVGRHHRPVLGPREVMEPGREPRHHVLAL